MYLMSIVFTLVCQSNDLLSPVEMGPQNKKVSTLSQSPIHRYCYVVDSSVVSLTHQSIGLGPQTPQAKKYPDYIFESLNKKSRLFLVLKPKRR